ncbi:MAG: LysM peptidoglycan-binding domain-containing protein [Desulfobacteraceae bacterium]|nr:LysM peptidoglycan-binding domain-containing protein [Desulfobacteraceae bacterium]
MKKKMYRRLINLILTVCLISACVPAGQKTMKTDPELTAEYLTQAGQFEKKGELPEALEHYKLALTVDPKNAIAAQKKSELTKKLSQMSQERYKLGMKYHRQGKYGLARKQFLTALKFNPDHEASSRMLVSRQPEKTTNYVYHIIQPGENLSYIAKKYYGDFRKFDAIAHFNNLDDVTKIKPGQRIMIPEISKGSLTVISPKEQEKSAFVWHKIKPGESISKLAQAYYGDYKLFHAIAQFNNMDDATQVSVGQKIKIPRLIGLPFNQPGKIGPVEQKLPVIAEQEQPEPEQTNGALELPEEPLAFEPINNEQALAYRDSGIEFYNNGKYEDAIFDLIKAVEASPEDEQTRHYLALAYFESGKQLFSEKYFEAAREAFESAQQYNPDCEQCEAYVEKSRFGPFLANRSKGIEYFNKNEFQSAIYEFESFLQKRPEDEEIRNFMSKAYFQNALLIYNTGDFLAAKNGFDLALQYDKQCARCKTYIDQSMDSFKESHYNKGVISFGKEQLAKAIDEWQMVYQIDPDYKDVVSNLKKARSLHERLERIKKSQQ